MPPSSRHSALALALLLVPLLAGCGKDGGNEPARPFDGAWSGTTSQARPFHFLVEKNAVVAALFGFSVVGTACTDDVTLFIFREPPDTPYPVSGAAFSFNTSGSRGTIAVIAELQENGAANGSLDVNAIVCNGSLPASWTASRTSTAGVNLTGTWSGALESSLVAQTDVTLTLSQSGTSLTGSYSTVDGLGGTISGTVRGRFATFTLSQTEPGCSGTFKGHAVVLPSPEMLAFAYTGSDCLGSHTGGAGSAIRP